MPTFMNFMIGSAGYQGLEGMSTMKMESKSKEYQWTISSTTVQFPDIQYTRTTG